MLAPRIIPVLLLHKNALYKTVNFDIDKYIGDPLNAVRIFNEKEVDEIFLIDIDATTNKKEPNFHLIEQISYECRMPLCYAGGIKNADQIEKLVSLGVEKVGISSEALNNNELISQAIDRVGSQSIVVILDVKKISNREDYEIFTHNGKKKFQEGFTDTLIRINNLNVGEIVINSIDQDGLMRGYDLKLAKKASNIIDLPITFLGGAKDLNDMKILFNTAGIVGAAAGSMFVFLGKYKAVMINYPSINEKKELIESINW
tara:strand:+ start:20246 stop:21022 length:777 start_codon:yes stop_codon:yes gene_type:complete